MAGGMSGFDLATEARKRRPGLKVLFTSGFAKPSAEDESGDGWARPLLNKPYRIHELAQTVRRVLDGEPARV